MSTPEQTNGMSSNQSTDWQGLGSQRDVRRAPIQADFGHEHADISHFSLN